MARRSRPSRIPPELADLSSDDYGEPDSATSLADWLSFAVGSVRRRKLVSTTVFVCVVAASITYYARSRPMYQVETKILAQRQLAVPSAVRSAGAGDPPTRTAEELILRRENLLDLARRADLLKDPPPEPAASLALDRALFKLGLGPDPGNADPLSQMVVRLGKTLVVKSTEDTIRISIKWRDPLQAYQIVEGALQNFLEARQTQEITAIDEAIALLQARLAGLRGQLDREEAKRDDTRREPVPLVPDATPRASAGASSSAELTRIRSLIDSKERAIRDMEDFRRKRLLELQSQLAERRNVYADAHPMVLGLQKEIEAFSLESPQIAELREQERQLRAEYAAQAAAEGSTRAESRGSSARSSRDARLAGTTQDDRVKDVRGQYLHLQERINAVQLELDGARAAFKHRYKVIWPAELPREPVSPDPWKILPLGLLAALLLAVLAAVVPDLWSRRIYEAWQVEHDLGLEILSDSRATGVK
jgi:uncharacterized protein involved in exopolysaccharide biosynthesis